MTKSDFVGVRLTPQERAALVAIAKKEERTVSNTIRWIVLREARQRGFWPPAPTQGEEAKNAPTG